jgi:hypothetical protein
MIAQFLKFLSATDAKAHAAAVAELQTMAVPAPVKKRKGNPEALRKWRESQKAGKPATVVFPKAAKKAAKPAKKARKTKAVKAAADGATRFGGLECLPYDGGVVLRPAGRRRGIGFRDYAEFCAFVNACRTDDAHKAGAFIKAHLAR